MKDSIEKVKNMAKQLTLEISETAEGPSKEQLHKSALELLLEVHQLETIFIQTYSGTKTGSTKPRPLAPGKIDDEETKKLIKVFGAPIAVHSNLRDGSLREAARKKGVKTLLFEGGEALRFDERAIKLCVKGCLSIMREIGILQKKPKVISEKCFFAYSSYWERAPHSGIVSFRKKFNPY